MKSLSILILVILASSENALAQQPAESLQLVEGDRVCEIEIRVTVDDVPYNEYWDKSFDAIFSFADVDSNGTLSEEEIRLIPSARAVRLSLGTGFTPPVAAIRSLSDLISTESSTCSKDDLRNYYRRHGVGRIQIGYGQLSNTALITAALLVALDEDRDGRLSQAEMQRAETTLQRLDTNDDELIGVGELIPNGTYPGSWAANTLNSSETVDLSRAGGESFVLKRLKPQSERNAAASTDQNQATATEPDKSIWQIELAEQLHDQPFHVTTNARCVNWSVQGPLMGLYDQLHEELSTVLEEPSNEEASEDSRGRRSPRAWLTPLVDRDRSGEASRDELDQWLALQRRLIRGQLLVSVYHGGGLFELLDSNHDAGLSVRELRSVWKTLEAASCTTGSHVDLKQVPNVTLFVVSHGYPDSLARIVRSEIEWFRLMDRNADGDVSRREFTGSPESFDRLDQDHDDLISPAEAAANN